MQLIDTKDVSKDTRALAIPFPSSQALRADERSALHALFEKLLASEGVLSVATRDSYWDLEDRDQEFARQVLKDHFTRLGMIEETLCSCALRAAPTSAGYSGLSREAWIDFHSGAGLTLDAMINKLLCLHTGILIDLTRGLDTPEFFNVGLAVRAFLHATIDHHTVMSGQLRYLIAETSESESAHFPAWKYVGAPSIPALAGRASHSKTVSDTDMLPATSDWHRDMPVQRTAEPPASSVNRGSAREAEASWENEGGSPRPHEAGPADKNIFHEIHDSGNDIPQPSPLAPRRSSGGSDHLRA